MTARRRLADVARGILPADLVLVNGRVFDCSSGELFAADVAIYDDTIAGVGTYRGLQSLDLRGRIILPGFLDAGGVLESSHLTLPEYARAVAVHGTTAALFDFRALSAVLGVQGLIAALDAGRRAAVDVFCAAPLWCADPWDSAATRFDALDPLLLSLPGLVARAGWLDGRALLDSGGVILGFPGADPYLPAVVEAPGVGEGDAAALAVIGAAADRRWLSAEEALAKLRQGLWLLAPEGPLESSVDELRWLSRSASLERCCLVSGVSTAAYLLEEGHLDAALRRAVRAGLPAAEAIRLVTARPAALLSRHNRGHVLPGFLADLVVVDDLKSFNVNLVLKSGRPVARQGEWLLPAPAPAPPQGRNSVRPALLLPEHLTVCGRAGPARLIDLATDGSTALAQDMLPCRDGLLAADPGRDVSKVAVLERHAGSGRTGVGFVRGLGLQRGALCCSFAGPGQNLIVAGADDGSMLAAAQHVIAESGGMAVAADGRVLAALALPYAGLLSPLSAPELARAQAELDEHAWALGCPLSFPFLTLASLADTSRGGLRLTERGLVDADRRRLLPLQD